VKAIASWWREFSKYSTAGTRTRITVAVIAAALGLLAGIGAAHASTTAPRAAHRVQTVRWTDYRHCLYKVSLTGVGAGGFRLHINTDTCHHKIWAVARCGTEKSIYGNVVTNPGHDSVTRGSCGTGNVGLIWWAARDNQFVTRNRLVTVLHCLSATRCNS
jgi:hypothetical protein